MVAHTLASPSCEHIEDKLIPLTSCDSLLEKHVKGLQQTIDRVFGKELKFQEELPLVKWEDCQLGAFPIYLLTTHQRARELHLFFHEMVSHWLVPEDQLHILSSRNLTFQMKERANYSYYFIEVIVHVEKESQLETVRENLPLLMREMKLVFQSKRYAQHFLEIRKFSAGGKSSFIYETMLSAIRRHPTRIEQDIFRDIQRFLAHCRKGFYEMRDARHLCRLITAHYLYNKKIQQEIKIHPEKRALYFKLLKTELHYPFGVKNVIGIAIAFNSLREYECFEERHILKAIQRFLPSVRVIADSYYNYRHEESKINTLYLEFEKNDGNDFSLDELLLLRKKLGAELKNSIEYLSPSLFIPRNEEELYRNIISLGQELKYVTDLPQAMITFQEQKSDTLKFNVILLRLLNEKNPASLQQLSNNLPQDDRFIQERVTPIGFLRKKYVKEANVFSLEIASKNFLRKNHSVDLLRARQYVAHLIEKLVGAFRDYNGGFLLKQNEHLESIKKKLGDEEKQHEFLIENLFYSLTPSIMQTLIPPEAGHELCALFLKTVEIPLPKKQSYLFEKIEKSDFLAITIKVKQSEVREKISESLKHLSIEPLKLTSGLVEVDGLYCICYLYLNPTKEQSLQFIERVEKTLESWAKKQSNLQILKIHLPRATQSLDPRIGADRTSGIVLKTLFEGLMRINDAGKPECAIADSVKVSKDGLRYTFTLKTTSWSNGNELTAFDFEYGWKKILDPSFKSPYGFLLHVIKNAEKAKQGQFPLSEVGIHVINEHTLVVDLEYPAPHFLGLLAHWTYSPLCKEIDQRHPGWAYHNAETHVCNGPFKLNVWKLNDDLEVVKNPLYWDAASVKIGKIEVHIIEDDTQALEMFKKGDLDWYGDPLTKIPLKELHALQKEREIDGHGLTGLFWLQLNIEQFPFSYPKLRRAFALIINRKHLIDNVLKRNDEPAFGFYHSSKAPNYDGNITLGRTLFKEALEELNLSIENFPTIIFTHSEIDEHQAISFEIGRQWEEAFGIKVDYERQLWNTYFETLNNNDYMVGGLSLYSRYEDPLYYLDLMIWRKTNLCVTRWQNQEFIQLIECAKREQEIEKREVFIQRAEKIVLSEMPLIPILFDNWRYLKNPRLKGINLSNIGQIDFRQAYLENQQ